MIKSCKMVASVLVLIMISLPLMGCAGINTKFYDANDKLIGRIEQDQPAAASVEKADLKMNVDTKEPGFWDKYVTPVLSGMSNKMQANIGG